MAGTSYVRFQPVQWRLLLDYPCGNLDSRRAGDPLYEANVQIARHGPHIVMEQAVGHRRIEERGNDTAMENAVVSLKSRVRLELAAHPSYLIGVKLQSERPGIAVAADEAVGMASFGLANHRSFSGRRHWRPSEAFRQDSC